VVTEKYYALAILHCPATQRLKNIGPLGNGQGLELIPNHPQAHAVSGKYASMQTNGSQHMLIAQNTFYGFQCRSKVSGNLDEYRVSGRYVRH
jgi:hypothetical protein